MQISKQILSKANIHALFNTNIALGCLQQGSYIARMMDYLAPFEYKYVSNVSNACLSCALLRAFLSKIPF